MNRAQAAPVSTGCRSGVHHPNEDSYHVGAQANSRRARGSKAFKPAEPTRSDYEKAQTAFDQNRERLKAERLAREAADSAGKQPKKLA
ncbi:hypothetical protein ACRAVF_12120 [Bradyrhizobium oligotrophicum S58]